MRPLTKRQIIILGTIAAPFAVVISLSLGNHAPPPPAMPINANLAKNEMADKATLEQMRADIKARMEAADALTLQAYAVMQKNDPHLPQRIETYRARFHARYEQLQNMTIEQWDAELRQRADQRRQRGYNPLATPSPSGR